VLLALAFKGPETASLSLSIIGLATANIVLAIVVNSDAVGVIRRGLQLSVLAMLLMIVLFLLGAKLSFLCETDICTILDYVLLAIALAALPVTSFIAYGKRLFERNPVED
jgi:hypothetical protein